MADTSVQEEVASVAMTVALQQLLDVAGIVADAVATAVVAVDEHHEVARLEGNLGTLVVAGGRAYPTLLVAIDGQAVDVDHAAANALVGFSLAADAEGQCVAHELGGVEAANAVAIDDGGEVDEVDEGVNLIECLALQDTAYECLGGRSVARGVFAAGFIHAARGGYGGYLLQALGGQCAAKEFLLLVYGVPQWLRERGVLHLGFDAGAHEVRAYRRYLWRNDDVHGWVKVTLARQVSVPSVRTMRMQYAPSADCSR